MKADPRTEAEVMHVLSRIVETASSRDVDGAMALFADDPNVFLLGTGVDEARTGHAAIREQIERDLTQSDALSWTLSPQNISAAGSVAWTSGDVVVRVTMGGQTLDIPHRLTTVLERRGAKWLIQQMHLSFANGAQVVGQSYPTNLEAVADAVGRSAWTCKRASPPMGPSRSFSPISRDRRRWPSTSGTYAGSPCCASTTRSCGLRSHSTVASR